MKDYKKLDCELLATEKYETKQYLKLLNLPQARLKFALRTKMTKTVQMNFKGDKKFALNKWQCNDCRIPDTQEHIVRCPHLNTSEWGEIWKMTKT